MSKLSKIGEELLNKLLMIKSSRDFIAGVMAPAKTDENWQIISEFIDGGEDVTEERLLLMAIALGETIE